MNFCKNVSNHEHKQYFQWFNALFDTFLTPQRSSNLMKNNITFSFKHICDRCSLVKHSKLPLYNRCSDTDWNILRHIKWNHLWKFYRAVKTTNMFINSLTLILFHISVSIITSYTQLEQRFNHPQSALTYLHTCFLLLPNKVNSTQRFSAILLFITKCHTDCLALFYNIGCNIPK